MSEIERNKAAVRAFTDAIWRNREVDRMGEFFVSDYGDAEIPGDPVAGLQAFFTHFLNRRPVLEVLEDTLTAEGDRVVMNMLFRYPNENPDVGPTGTIYCREINQFTLRDGKIAARSGAGITYWYRDGRSRSGTCATKRETLSSLRRQDG